ncbi:glutamate receptor 1.2 [Brassica rapa]|uniref:Glutamate receptor n=1 Tax=Brassica campestris TaxID=3711 RepID=M4F521_BRACM|nr:glutamate receptor 1.2 [Brassica rapa]
MKRFGIQNAVLLVSFLFVVLLFTCFASSQNDGVYEDSASDYKWVRIRVGLVLDLDSLEGKMVGRSVTTALSDFYAVTTDHKTRVSLSIRNSHGEPLLALASAVDLLQSEEVEAIITAGDSILETKLLAEIGEKSKVPVISIKSPVSSSLSRYNHLIQVTHDSSSEAKGITAFIHGFDWNSVGLVYEDEDDWRDSMQQLVDHFYENGVGIQSKAGFAVSSTQEMVMDRLGKMKDLGTSVFVVHLSEVIATRLFECAERLGMMGEGFAWILTAKSMTSFHGKEAMEGVVGFKTYIPMSRVLQNFTLRLRTSLGNGDDNRLSVSGVWAHDVAWALARSAEMVNASSTLLEAITECRFKSLSGDFQVKDKKFLSDKFEIVNLLESGERRIGFWNGNGSFSSRRHFNKLEAIIWPGGSAQTPRGRALGESIRRKLRVLVTSSNRFPSLMDVETSAINVTTVKGFCIEVFQAAIAPFNYDLEFIPWRNGSNYDNLAIALSTQKDKYDAAVGDITITANRSKYVDFTMPFTDMGLGIVAPKESSMWVFFHPLTRDLWITSAAFFVLTGTIVWLIERPDNKEFQGSWQKQIGVIFWFGFSTLVYAHREKLQHNLSRFVVTVWIFAVLILTTSYTATLTSMMTVQQIRFNSNKDHVGHLSGSLIANMSLTGPKFRSTNTKGLNTSKDYAQALLDNTVSFVVDELPYLKVLLGENPEKFLMVKAHCNTIGFGFMFQKGGDLVHRVSMEILKLRASDKISEMEKRSFESKLPYTADDTSNPLTLYMFRGLFMITGVSSALALALLLIIWLRDNWEDLMNSVNLFLSRRLVHFRILCATSIHPNPLDDENAVQMAQRN